jgi:glycosyltransferase involved in cell wall biosynthesis
MGGTKKISMNPIISIIIPVYKVEAYLRECLNSVLAQVFIDYECILVDDGSPDGCPAICDEYAEAYPQMKVIHKKNGGLSNARNMGIRAAEGKYIVLLDSDDLFAAGDALINLYDIIKSTDAPVIFNSNLTLFTNNGDKLSYDGLKGTHDRYTPIRFYKKARSNGRLILAGCLFTIQRDFLLKNDLFFKKGIFHEDEHWFPRVIALADMIAINHGLFYAYRRGRIDSITATSNPKRLFDVILIIKEFMTVSKKTDCPIENKKIFHWHAAQLWTGIYMQLPSVLDSDSKQFNEILNNLDETKNILFAGRNVKYILFGILLFFMGIRRFHNIKKTIFRLKIAT